MRAEQVRHLPQRVAQLDSLRGIAAVLVVLHHSRQAFINNVNDAWTGLSAYLDMGRLGVVIFFMISGFVIVKAIARPDARAAGLFWKHRFFRLYPAFWISVFFATVVAALVGTACCAFVVPVTAQAFVANMTMIPLRFHQPMLVGVYWSLELELFFYALVTVMTLARASGARAMAGAACLLFATAVAAAAAVTLRGGSGEIGKDQLFLAALHLSMMFAGGAMRFHWDRRPTRDHLFTSMPRLLKAYLALQFTFFIAVAGVKARHGIDPHTFRVAATYLLGIGAFLLCLRFFDGSWLGTFMGNRSYGIYLLHVPVLGLLSYAIARFQIPGIGYGSYVVAAGAVTLILADLMRRFVERPAIRLGHAHDRWVLSRRAPLAEALAPKQPG